MSLFGKAHVRACGKFESRKFSCFGAGFVFVLLQSPGSLLTCDNVDPFDWQKVLSLLEGDWFISPYPFVAIITVKGSF